MAEYGIVDYSNKLEMELSETEENWMNHKKQKSSTKAAFTRARNELYNMIEGEDVPFRAGVRNQIDQLSIAQEKAMDIMVKFSEWCLRNGDVETVKSLGFEMTKLEEDYESAVQHAEDYLDSRSDNTSVYSHKSRSSVGHMYPPSSSKVKQNPGISDQKPVEQKTYPKANVTTSAAEGSDMLTQLKRISIPVFTGDFRSYQSWKAAFIACIDNTQASPEYKLLHLRQYLRGEALRVISDLGHSAVAYQVAMERLERRFGGKRRQIALYLEEIDSFRPIRSGCAKDLQCFADMLDVAVVNLREADQIEELGSGLLYMKLQQKMTKSMVSDYHRWVSEYQRQESVETLREWVLKQAEFQTIASETVHGLYSKSRSGRVRVHDTHYGQTNSKQAIINRQSCKVCQEPHEIGWNCRKFKSLSIIERWDKAKELGLCFRCLGSTHRGKNCRKTRECSINGCTSNHNRLLHVDRVNPGVNTSANINKSDSQSDKSEISQKSDETTMSSRHTVSPSFIALRTFPVYIRHGNTRLKVNALLDASTCSYINADVASELGLQGKTKKVTVNVLNEGKAIFETMPVEFGLESLDGSLSTTVTAYTTNKVTGDLKVVEWKKYGRSWKHLKQINFPETASPPIVDVLIGMDYPDLHFSKSDVRGNPGEPLARLTPLGWTCIGNIGSSDSDSQTYFANTFFSRSNADDQELNVLVQRFWEVEQYESKEIMTPKDKALVNTVKRSMIYADSHYQIGIPWKESEQTLPPDNYEMAIKRLENTEKKLAKNETIAIAYDNAIAQYEAKGYIRRVNVEENHNIGRWFLPHFPIVRPDRLTTKVRIVFDAPAKFKGISLNDVIHQGPKLQRELFDILLRFRKNPVALMCDIAEMYLQILIPLHDRPYHRFLWRSMKRDSQPVEYEFSRVVFGVNSSPFLAQLVTQEHAKKYQCEFPLAAKTVDKSTYMDDSMDSVRDEKTAIELYKQLKGLWSKAGMTPRKWLSNSHEVLQEIPVEERLAEIQLDKSFLPSVKTLGLMWLAEKDIFTFTPNLPDDDSTVTKRIFLRKVARLFDPLGFLSPFIIRAKIILQKMWTAGLEWDDKVDHDLNQKATQWLSELDDLNQIQVQRCLCLRYNVAETELHCFVDASEDAYGAVIYVVHIYENDQTSSFIAAAKGRVAPLKATSIPRLELMAAVVGSRLTGAVTKALEITIDGVTFWSDSSNVLGWIRNHSRTFKPFIANRVSEIQSSTNPSQWRHVPTSDNPADLITRGISTSKLINNSFWWSGPRFLVKGKNEWPSQLYEFNCKAVIEKKKDDAIITLAGSFSKCDHWRLDPSRYSDWMRLVRVHDWVYRFLNNCTVKGTCRSTGELTAEELESSQLKLIAQSQREEFSPEYSCLKAKKLLPTNSKLSGLQPRLDEDGVMRSVGRLSFAQHLSPEARMPIILARRSWITKLIVKFYHEQGNHVAGINHTLALLSSKYWILAGREAIREWEHECSMCRKQKAQAAHQIMAPLTNMRITPSFRAFTHVGVDFAGPFFTVQGRKKSRQKRYLCLFTCVATRAVHLEIAFGMDTDSFLNAFYRMVNRRGLPEEIVCDNGTNFIGAQKELKTLVASLDNNVVKRSLANRGTKWNFNPPFAAHFGGIFETMIKAAKRAMNAVLGQSDVTDEELITAVTGVEALINSRPLTYQTSHPSDDIPLTPNHFIHGQCGGIFAPESVDTTVFSPRKRWRRLQELVKHVWSRWMKEWIPGLGKRRKWLVHQRDIQVDDIVLLISPNTTRGHWPVGRVIKTYPGRDGYIRVVDVKVGQSIYTRPVNKVCPLEWSASQD